MAKIRINECSYDEMLSLTGLILRSARMLWSVKEEKGNLKPIDFKYILGITSRQNITGLLDFSPCRVWKGKTRGKTCGYREETLNMGTGRHVSGLGRRTLMPLKVSVMPTSYPNTRLILQKIFGGKLVSRERIGKPMIGSNGGALLA